jgi:hypothetical protein
MRLGAFLGVWCLALVGWWVLLVGTNAGLELVAGVCAALLGAGLAAAVRRRGLLRFGFEPRWLLRTLRVPWHVVRDLAVVVWALALHLSRIRPVRSAYRAIPFPTGGSDPLSAGLRALVTAAQAISPNTVPVDIDRERGVLLRHELDPRKASNDLP